MPLHGAVVANDSTFPSSGLDLNLPFVVEQDFPALVLGINDADLRKEVFGVAGKFSL
jgi:hypothetical protein